VSVWRRSRSVTSKAFSSSLQFLKAILEIAKEVVEAEKEVRPEEERDRPRKHSPTWFTDAKGKTPTSSSSASSPTSMT